MRLPPILIEQASAAYRRSFAVLAFASAVWVAEPTYAQASPAGSLPDWASQRSQTPRRAFVLGISNYASLVPLPASGKDADLMDLRLRELGFSVTKSSGDQSRSGILTSLDTFLGTLTEGDIGVFYYSGHGVERGGANYLVPADVSNLVVGREGLQALNVEYILDEFQKRKVSLGIVVLDACRNDPFPAAGNGPGQPVQPKGLAPIEVDATGIFLGFAAAPRRVAYGGLANDAPNSPSVFTRFLGDEVTKEGRSLFDIWNRTGQRVLAATSTAQQPWQSSTLFPMFKPKPAKADLDEADGAWREALSAATAANMQSELETYIRIYPDSPYAPAARTKLRALRQEAEVAGAKVASVANTLKEIQLTGTVAQITTVGDAEGHNRVLAARDLILLDKPSASGNIVTPVRIGSFLRVLSLPNTGGWAAVETSTGLKGYASAVSSTSLAMQKVGGQVSFVKDKAALAAGSEQTVQRMSQAGKSGAPIVLEVGLAGAAVQDRALSLSYLRALKLRSALITGGVPADRITMRIGSNDVAPDQAKVTALYAATKE